jgi:hypothetical protein
MDCGGPRSSCRSADGRRGAADSAAGEKRSTRAWRALIAADESANTGPLILAVARGQYGQCDGALNAGPDCARNIAVTAVCSSIAQWWAPLRRQQAGRRESSPPWNTATSGPSQKIRISRTEGTRRIWRSSYNTCVYPASLYIKSGIIGSSGSFESQ